MNTLTGLLQSGDCYPLLFERIGIGAAHCRLIQQGGAPVDWVYLDVNPIFHYLTGLQDVVGRRVSELLPGLRESSPEIFELYGRVVRNQESESARLFVPLLARWVGLNAFATGGEEFLVTFQDITAEMEAQEKVVASEARFRSLFDSTADAVLLIGPEGKFIDANQVAMDRLGYSREELLQLGPKDINPPGAAHGVAQTFAKLEQEGWATFVSRHVCKDGSSLPVEIFSRRATIGGKELIVSTVRDITERVLAAEALAQETGFARSVFDACEDCLAVVDADGRILDVNEAWKEFGRQNGAGSEDTWSVGASYFRPQRGYEQDCPAGAAYDGIRKVQTGELPSFDMAYACNSPTEARWFLMHVVPMQGRPGVVLVTHRNETANKIAADRIQESERKWRTLFDVLPVGVAVLDDQHQVQDCNPALGRILGLPPEGVRARSLEQQQFFRPDGSLLPAEDFPSLRAVREQGRVEPVEAGVRKENGETVWTRTSAAPLDLPGYDCVVVIAETSAPQPGR